MKTLDSLDISIYNEKKLPLVDETIHSWLPYSNYIFTLWPVFTGESRYIRGYWVSHSSFEKYDIQIVLEGSLRIRCGNREYLLQAGDAGFIPHGPHRLETGPDGFCRKRCLGIQGIISKILVRQFGLDNFFLLHDFHSAEFDRLYDRIHRLLGERNYSTIPELSRLAYDLMMLVISMRNAAELPPELILCKQYIEQNLSNPISAADLCHAAGCGETTLVTLFRKQFGESPVAHLIRIRMEYAGQLLAGNALSIKETARLCGYNSQLYFSNVFRKHYGMPPKQYRSAAAGKLGREEQRKTHSPVMS